MKRTIARSVLRPLLLLTLVALVGCGGAKTAEKPAASAPAAQGGAGQTTPAEETPAEPPAAPADVSGMTGWLEAAYPDAAWLSRIKKIEYVPGEVKDSGGFANAIVVTTDLDFGKELPVANEIAAALGEANVSWAKQSVVRFADGKNILAGDLVDMTP